MNLPEPVPHTITVYTKSNCSNCDKLKAYLIKNSFIYQTIDCDPYLEDEEMKNCFLTQMHYYSGKKIKSFPMVFYDCRYIGGYYDLLEYYGDF